MFRRFKFRITNLSRVWVLLGLLGICSSCKEAYVGPMDLSLVVNQEKVKVRVGSDQKNYDLFFKTVVYEEGNYYGISQGDSLMLNPDISKGYVMNSSQNQSNMVAGFFMIFGTILLLGIITILTLGS